MVANVRSDIRPLWREAARSLSSVACGGQGDKRLWHWALSGGADSGCLHRDSVFVILAVSVSAPVGCTEVYK